MSQPIKLPENVQALVVGTTNERGQGHDVERFAYQQYTSILGRIIQLETRIAELENRVY